MGGLGICVTQQSQHAQPNTELVDLVHSNKTFALFAPCQPARMCCHGTSRPQVDYDRTGLVTLHVCSRCTGHLLLLLVISEQVATNRHGRVETCRTHMPTFTSTGVQHTGPVLWLSAIW